ncbi:hypothetical protein [Myxococcus landrumensis]|uniref:DUF5666 domain-containing protein n=1 Tax=Myxococcus landrumensis TaxID=2813577 RepID=A0ABX7N3F1_9BACT|nr:hypothetical protein [Myxococcus landrumus]QSQ11926.1 hypothetical protein JY572_26505 [Myxococcus landrumus]
MTRNSSGGRFKSTTWAMSSLAALLLPLVGGARDPNVGETTEQGEVVERLGDPTGPAIPPLNLGGMIGVDVTPTQPQAPITQGPQVDVLPDPKRTQTIEGNVVEMKGDVLYVQDEAGAVIPLDMQALRLKQTPKPGEHVVADYQIENEVQNMATSLHAMK